MVSESNGGPYHRGFDIEKGNNFGRTNFEKNIVTNCSRGTNFSNILLIEGNNFVRVGFGPTGPRVGLIGPPDVHDGSVEPIPDPVSHAQVSQSCPGQSPSISNFFCFLAPCQS